MFSKFFIDHPVFASVVAIVIVLIGTVAVVNLPIAWYPTIAPVQIQVTTSYAGADAETVAQSVAAPIEAEINGVANMLYMTSTSSASGQLTINVYFDLSTDPDIDQVLVQNRVNLATPQLPQAVIQYGVNVQQQSSSVLMIVGLYAKNGRYPLRYVTNYANIYVLSAIQRVPGAGQATMFGNANQAMRVWLNPDRMASLGITTTQIKQAIAGQNQVVGAGQLGQPPNDKAVEQTFPITGQRQFTEAEQYEDILLRASQDGSALVHLGDVARAQVGSELYLSDSELNEQPTPLIVIYQQPGANAIQVSNGVRKTLEELKQDFPDGLDYVIALDTTDFVRLSIKEVVHTLGEAILLVIAIMYLFLQSFRATVIATMAILVSIVGTFVGMLLLGFSLNLVTLFGLVLAIGLVVDDAIVVIENADRNMMEHKQDPKAAVLRAMSEVTGPVVAIVLVLCAVFIPAAFIGGPTGQLYKQFAVTIAVSITISGFVALTLTPMMCALLLRTSTPPQRGFFAWFNRSFKNLEKAYGRAIMLVIRHTSIALLLFGALVLASWQLLRMLPTSFVPQEDQGYIFALGILPDAASLDRTKALTHKMDQALAQNPAVLYRISVAGYNIVDGQYEFNVVTFFVALKPYSERESSSLSADAVIRDFMRHAAGMREGIVLGVPPPSIPGLASQGGFQFWLQNQGTGNAQDLERVTREFLAKARQRPELAKLSMTYNASGQQLHVAVDREKAVLLGVPISSIFDTLQAQFGSLFVSQFQQFNRVWYVIVQADSKYRRTPDDISRLYVGPDPDHMVPLSTLVNLTYTAGPALVSHFNSFPAVQITGDAAPGYSSGQAIAAMEETARATLPQGYAFGWSGVAFAEKQAGGAAVLVFGFGIVLVFLILAAQFESWALPTAVMTAVPFGVLGAAAAVWLRGLESDVYFQIGLLTMIGLAAKNAILIIEFAVEKRKEGLSIIDAAVEAGELRLRPIIMTSLAFIFGTLPLVIATGAGANARHSIGTGITGGMIGASTLALLFVPLFFYLFERLKERRESGATVEKREAPPAHSALPQPGSGASD
ncbi:MAG TPA: multidrug efflux RND transporter permease subunit [Stellaceae bacterium]|nr:multidrug efflux RND transporter permease subunit [Stellaceae bacterium]